jgi:hypothetical protein
MSSIFPTIDSPVTGEAPLLTTSNYRYITPSFRRRVQMDPTAPGTIIRYALAIEIALNIFMGTSLLFCPSWLLTPTLSNHSSLNATTITICQWVGAIILASTIQVVLLLPNTRAAIECRKLVYWMLLAGEGCLVPLFLWQAIRGGEAVGFTRQFLLINSLMFGVHMSWRLFCLLVKPKWFGRYRDLIGEY